MYALICNILPMKDVNGVVLGDSVVQISEEIFEVSGAFMWKEINELDYGDLNSLYYLNGDVIEYIPTYTSYIPEPSVLITMDPDPTITDQDLMI
jgi:hypothetical protein